MQKMDQFMCTYKDKLDEALTLVPSMNRENKIEAVVYWNNVAAKIQNIVDFNNDMQQHQTPPDVGTNVTINDQSNMTALTYPDIDNSRHVITTNQLVVSSGCDDSNLQSRFQSHGQLKSSLHANHYFSDNTSSVPATLADCDTIRDNNTLQAVSSDFVSGDDNLRSTLDDASSRSQANREIDGQNNIDTLSTQNITDNPKSYDNPIPILNFEQFNPQQVISQCSNGTATYAFDQTICVRHQDGFIDEASSEAGQNTSTISNHLGFSHTNPFEERHVVEQANETDQNIECQERLNVVNQSNEDEALVDTIDTRIVENNFTPPFDMLQPTAYTLHPLYTSEPFLDKNVSFAKLASSNNDSTGALNSTPTDTNRSSQKADSQRYMCTLCNKATFSTKGNLKRHLRAHTGERPYKCSICEADFPEKKTLDVHIRRHTGEKPYVCDICNNCFSQSGVLKSHRALHFEERKFKCQRCSKAFRQKSQLNLHMQRHDGVKKLQCSNCNARFVTKGDLERHFRIHTGERPYMCEICRKRFTRQQSLNEHMNRHVGHKPFSCKQCGKAFCEMSACYKHNKIHKKFD